MFACKVRGELPQRNTRINYVRLLLSNCDNFTFYSLEKQQPKVKTLDKPTIHPNRDKSETPNQKDRFEIYPIGKNIKKMKKW